LAVGEEPKTMQLALDSENRAEWEAALKEEHQSIKNAGTYELVDRPWGKKVLRSKYVLKIKRNQDGTVNKYKVRLVILGNMQTQGEDYTETFAPVMKYQSLRTILALACEEGMHVHQMDVKTAFLNGELEEEVYMEQPDYMVQQENKVWKLKRALYGLKQAPRAWNRRLHLFLEGLGFCRSLYDTAIYVKGKGDDRIIISVYVDDLLIVSKNLNSVEAVKTKLKQEFEMSDFGEASSILGIQITRNLEQGWLELDQNRYVEVILEKFGMTNCDSDYAGDVDSMRSTGGYVFLLTGGAISWSSKRQATVALSSTEAEYMAATHASKEALWLKRLIGELGWRQSAVEVFCDNQSALKLMRNPQYHARTKHISVQFHFVRELIEAGELDFQFVGTNLQCADFLTKGVPRAKLEGFRCAVGLVENQHKS
jgi:hypothetical protein